MIYCMIFWEDVQESIDGYNIYIDIYNMLHGISNKELFYVRTLLQTFLKNE